MHICLESEVVRTRKEYNVFAWHVQKHLKPGGPPLKWLPVSCDDMPHYDIILRLWERGSLMHIAPETAQNELVLHPNEIKKKTSSASSAWRKNNQSVRRSYWLWHTMTNIASFCPNIAGQPGRSFTDMRYIRSYQVGVHRFDTLFDAVAGRGSFTCQMSEDETEWHLKT